MANQNRVAVLLITCLSLLATFPATADEEKRRAFSQAYEQYETLYKKAKYTKSLTHAEVAYRLGSELFEEGSEDVANLAFNYAHNLVKTRQPEKAKAVMLEALAGFEEIFGPDSIESVPALMDLGHIYARTKNRKAKKAHYSKGIGIATEVYGESSAEYGWFLVNAGKDMLVLAGEKEGYKKLLNGYEILKTTLGPGHVQTGYAAYHLGSYELSGENMNTAKRYFLEALDSFELPDQPSNAFELGTHANLVQVFEELGQRDNATRHCQAIGRMTPFESTQNYFPLLKRAPVYPNSALYSHVEGYTIVEYEVDKNGLVVNPRVVENNGHQGFVKASLEAAKNFRYAPRFVDGKPVPVERVQNKFTFEIVR